MKINKRVPFEITDHPKFDKLSHLYPQKFELIWKHHKVSKTFPKTPLLAFRRSKTRKWLLMTIDLYSSSGYSFVSSWKGCEIKRCLTCKPILNNQNFIYLLHCKCTLSSGNLAIPQMMNDIVASMNASQTFLPVDCWPQ